MAECKLVPLNVLGDECAASDGGIYKTAIMNCDDVVDFIFGAEGKLDNIVMASVGNIVIYEYDDDASASYQQTAARTNKKVEITQTATFKYAGVTCTTVDYANGITSCCCLYAIHFFNNGQSFTQGIDYNPTTGLWKKNKTRLKATVSINSETSDGEDNAVTTLESVGGHYGACSNLTVTDLEAL